MMMRESGTAWKSGRQAKIVLGTHHRLSERCWRRPVRWKDPGTAIRRPSAVSGA